MAKKTVILTVDDDKDILYTLKAIGATVGWNVYTESNSIVAVSKVRTLKPDLILIDYHMPQQNGILTVKQIRTIDSTVPIIVLTVDDRQEIADSFLDAGANDFANKPIRVPDLVARINVHLKLLEKQRESQGFYLVTKGINEATFLMVSDYCHSAVDGFYIEDVARSVGLAYQTAVRYLQYMVAKDELLVISDYGKVGRPRNKYKYKL